MVIRLDPKEVMAYQLSGLALYSLGKKKKQLKCTNKQLQLIQNTLMHISNGELFYLN